MSPSVASARPLNGTGGTTQGRVALTANELNIVLCAAHRALADSGEDISPSKVNRIVRKFAKHLARSHLTFYEFLSAKADQQWVHGDPVLHRVIRYCDDPTGEKAVNHVMRQWDSDTRTYYRPPDWCR